jgi:hypothetical protein
VRILLDENLPNFPAAVIVLRSRSNRLADLRRLIPDLLAAITSAKPGAATIVGS